MNYLNPKQLIIACSITLFIASCGDNTATDSNTGTKEEQAEVKSVELTAIATSAEVEKAYNDILKKAGTTDPEIMEFSISYHVMRGNTGNSGSLIMQMVSPKDKNKIESYQYSFNSSEISITEVTLSSGMGTDEKFIDKYDDFKMYLFKKSDMVDFSKLDNIYKDAVEKSTYKADECNIDVITITKEDNKIKNYLKVQSAKSGTAYKNMYFTNDGKVSA